ncbi:MULTISPECIES: ferredoxin [unclassified Streptomyces]|uniref:ferredoxin n=1 Tax=unclassified Streptomyces TaxID=2593676 RepID=UPI002E2D40FD|nr:ferredoxin [Streptomyces sp. NBC_00223]
MRVHVDQEKCCGSGLCVLTAPGVFDQRDEDGIVLLLAPEPPEPIRPDVREASTVCPSGAITVTER